MDRFDRLLVEADIYWMRIGATRLIFLLFLVCCLSVDLGAQGAVPAVRIGILAKRGFQQCYEQWNQTAEYLDVKIPESTFIIVPLDFDKVEVVVKNRAIDFIFANPSDYVFLETRYRINRIVTLKNLIMGQGYIEFGGVVFCRADRVDMHGLNDLKNKVFAAVDETSFGGWLMTYRELKKHGIDPNTDFSRFAFAGTHDAVVKQVLSGDADAGTMRSDTLEQMEAEGKIRKAQLRILNDMGAEYPAFPFALSTRLYPEWPLAKLQHTDLELAEKVASALLEMKPTDPAALAANCAGWTIPSNYESINELLKELRVAPYDEYGIVTAAQILEQYWPHILATALTILLAITMTGM